MVGLAQQEAGCTELDNGAVDGQIGHAEQQQPDRERLPVIPPEHGRHHRHRAQRPEVGRSHRIAAKQVGSVALADGPAHQAAVDEAVQMGRVGQSDGAPADHAAAVHREQRFEDRIGAQQQRKHRGNLRVAMHQQDAEFCDPETEEVGAAVTEEDQAERVVEDEEAQHRTQADQRAVHDRVVPHLERHIGQRRQHDGHAHRGQAVEAVDDVDRIGNTSHRQQCQRERESSDQQQAVHAGNARAGNDGIRQPDRECGSGDGREQALLGRDALGEVFDQAGAEGDKAAADQRHQQLPVVRAFLDGDQSTAHHTDQDPDAADAWHDPCMELLGLVLVGIARQMRMAGRGLHHQQRGGKRRQERTN